MFCPKCGSNQGGGRKFCTLCGTNLAAVSQALTGRIEHPSFQIEKKRDTSQGGRLIIIGAGFLAWQFSSLLFSHHFSGSMFGTMGIVGFILLAIGISKTVSRQGGGPPPPHWNQPPLHQVQYQAPQYQAPQHADPQPTFSALKESSAPVPQTNELEPVDRFAPGVTEDDTLHLPSKELPTELAKK